MQNSNDSEVIYLSVLKAEKVGTVLIWDGVPQICPNKRKTTAFNKFSVLFGEEKSTFTLS